MAKTITVPMTIGFTLSPAPPTIASRRRAPEGRLRQAHFWAAAEFPLASNNKGKLPLQRFIERGRSRASAQ
jgi:hypothetical protein